MDDTLYCIETEEPETDIPLGEVLAAVGLNFASSSCDDSRTTLTLYCKSVEEREDAVSRYLAVAGRWSAEAEVGIPPLRLFELPKERWAGSWRHFFHALEISDRLLVKPVGEETARKTGQKELMIDPGLSFGTGQHATTSFCLRVIDKFSEESRSMLDVGTGSGILALAAKLEGVAKVDAFDNDPEAVSVAKENVRVNGLDGQLVPFLADAGTWRCLDKYDLVCANLLSGLLLAFRDNIDSWVAPGGKLVLAGMLSKEYDGVRSAYEELGYREIISEAVGGWKSGCLKKPVSDRRDGTLL